MTTLPDDDMTELTDFRPDRVDLVGKGANGIPFLIAKQDESSRGLIPPGVVRDLIAKADPEPQEHASGGERAGHVTMTGSPAAVAAFIHKASVRPADDVAKAKNDTADRKHKAATGAAMQDGSYPIANEADLDKAIHAVGRGGSSHNAIRKHIISRAKSLGASSKIPDNWNSDGSLGESVSKETGVTDTVAKDALVQDPDDGLDGMDPTVPMAAPDDDDAPGDPTDPGSPAWEAIDAATAQKWTAIAVRLKNALGILADRENLEALTADPDDQENAWDLQDAMCACDFVIDTLAGFAVSEQAEADLACEAMDSIGKAMAGFDPAPLDVIEGLAVVRKAGRVLSAANEAKVRSATESLQQVLASLPSAPVADDSVTKEAAMPATETETTPEADVAKEDAAAQDAPEGGTGAPAAGVAKADDGPSLPVLAWDKDGVPGTVAWEKITKARPGQVAVYDQSGGFLALARPGEPLPVAKADADGGEGKTPMQAVFDQNGKLIGIVDPDAITPVAGAGGAPADGKGDDDPAKPEDPAAAKPADPADMTPAPSADAGTPASGTDDDVAKNAGEAETSPDGTTEDPREVFKSALTEVVQEIFGTQNPAEGIAKQADVAAIAEVLKAFEGRLVTVENNPAASKVFTNGATPPPGTLRGQDKGGAGQPVDVAKAAELKKTLYTGTAQEQNEAFGTLQGMAIEQLGAIQRR